MGEFFLDDIGESFEFWRKCAGIEFFLELLNVSGHFKDFLIEAIGFMGLEIETVLEVLIFGKETLKLSLEFLFAPEGVFVELLHFFVGICQSGAVLLENFGFSLVLYVVEMLEFLVQLVNLLA